MIKQRRDAIRAQLIEFKFFTERHFEAFIKAVDAEQLVEATKEARMIRQKGLRDAYEFAKAWINE